MRLIDLQLRGDHIALDALLKACGLVSSGGEAKAMIVAGKVQVDGRVELRRGRKVRAGEAVGVHGARVRVAAATDAGNTPGGTLPAACLQDDPAGAADEQTR